MIRSFAFAAAMAALAPATSFAASAVESPCVLDSYQVLEVHPYRVNTQLGKPAVARLRGAEIYVHARPGVTAEWLRHEIAESMVRTPGMPDCVISVEAARVQVTSRGHGYVVRVIAPDTAGGREVLARARLMVA